MPRCEVLNALKWNGVRHAPGSVLDLSDEQIASLPEGTVRVEQPPAPAAAPRSPRSAAAKTDAVKQARERVAKQTGKSAAPPQPEPTPEDSPAPEPAAATEPSPDPEPAAEPSPPEG